MKPVCVPCQRFYRVKKNGFRFIEGMPIGKDVQPGNIEPDKWTPYKLWAGDLYECQGCGSTIISGVASQPISEHYMEDFKELVELSNARFQVNDC